MTGWTSNDAALYNVVPPFFMGEENFFNLLFKQESLTEKEKYHLWTYVQQQALRPCRKPSISKAADGSSMPLLQP